MVYALQMGVWSAVSVNACAGYIYFMNTLAVFSGYFMYMRVYITNHMKLRDLEVNGMTAW